MSQRIQFDKNKWFLETPFPGIRRCKRDLFFIQKEIYRKRTKFQEIFIFLTPGFGKILTLDGIVQFSQLDEANYHETMAHTALFTHPAPKNILIIGGGDGGVLREVCRHKEVELVHMVEIDEEVPLVCQKYFPSISQRAFKDKRVKLFFEDGAKFLKNRISFYDVVIVDSTDPVGPGKVLFELPFYEDVYKALTSKGIAIFQAGPFLDLNTIIKNSVKSLKSLFKYVNLLRLPMPSYSCGCEYCFILASKQYNPLKISRRTLELKCKISLTNPSSLKYYNPSVHLASLVIPPLWQI